MFHRKNQEMLHPYPYINLPNPTTSNKQNNQAALPPTFPPAKQPWTYSFPPHKGYNLTKAERKLLLPHPVRPTNAQLLPEGMLRERPLKINGPSAWDKKNWWEAKWETYGKIIKVEKLLFFWVICQYSRVNLNSGWYTK